MSLILEAFSHPPLILFLFWVGSCSRPRGGEKQGSRRRQDGGLRGILAVRSQAGSTRRFLRSWPSGEEAIQGRGTSCCIWARVYHVFSRLRIHPLLSSLAVCEDLKWFSLGCAVRERYLLGDRPSSACGRLESTALCLAHASLTTDSLDSSLFFDQVG